MWTFLPPSVDGVLQELTQTQLAMVAHWETFLPEIKRVA